MKLWIFAVTLAVLAVNVESHTDTKYDPQLFSKLRPCYESREVRDKARSLPMTLDYFLYLVEKVQRHRDMKSFDAVSMASVLIGRFQMNGIEDKFPVDGYEVTINVQQEQPKIEIVKEFIKVRPADYVENTLLPEEQCALHYMLSWSNNMTNPSKTESYDPSYTNFNARSNGLVYSGLFGNLALGPVLQGIAIDRSMGPKTIGEIIDHLKGGDIFFGDNNADSIMGNTLLNTYATTISAELGQSAVWAMQTKRGSTQYFVGPKGYWNNTYCPSNYTLADNTESPVTLLTAAEIVGAIDGFVIASKLQEAPSSVAGVKLAQVIRMYYGKGLLQNSYNACERKSRYNSLAANVQQQSLHFAYAYASVSKMLADVSDVDTNLGYVMSAFQRDYLDNNFLDCNQSNSYYFTSGKSQKYEYKNDILFMIDVDSKESDDGFWEQKEFVMNLMREMDSMLNGSRYGLYKNSGGSQQLFPLDPNYSSARRRCEILQEIIDPTSTDMPAAIRYIKEVIRDLKNKQRTENVALAPGKVVVFVFLQPEFKNKEDVQKEIQNMKWEHPDVTLLAVGRNAEPLKLLVRNTEKDVFFKSGEPIVSQVPKILSRLTTSPVTIEYPRCNEGDQNIEGNFVATEYVYQNSYQWFSVPQIYFNTSWDMKLKIRSDYGTIRVCSTRQRPESFNGVPNFESDKCKEVTVSSTSSGDPVGLFGPMEPCYDYPDGGCPNFYFHVQGKSKSATEICKNDTCDSLHQIQLTITHTGMRCTGSFTGVEISFLVMSVLVSIFTLWA